MSEPRHGAPLCLEWASTATDRVLGAFLDAQARTALGPEHASAARDIGGLIAAGGKRIRPQFCVLGWHAASSEGEPEALARAAASLELFHLFALIHDDVMDGSALRRGRPTLHRALAARYRAHADPDHLGVNAAILIGDLAFAWSQQMLHTAGLAPGRLAAVLPVMDAMRCGVMYGQYLDLLATGAPEPLALDEVLAVARFKTATYTVERPLHLGTVLAGSEPPLLEALSRFALPLGEAVQLRDDLLGVFGAPGRTGKPALAPATNVAAVRSTLDGADLSAVPEVYATVWSGLFGNLDLQPGETSWCAERPSRSARPPGQPGVDYGATVLATTRDPLRALLLKELGAADVLMVDAALAPQVAERGSASTRCSTSSATASCVTRRPWSGRAAGVCQLGFLGGFEPRLRPDHRPPQRSPAQLLRQRLPPGRPRVPAHRRTAGRDLRQGPGRFPAGPSRPVPAAGGITGTMGTHAELAEGGGRR
ncbi:polyprenyl synthetase family protein [Streptomyces sp. DSM 41634]|uniref:polyprenyl synthetase family protein n=1 Tax=Streptomyces sp. DSM 41634 TaxID=3448656 RepID=UPI002883C3D7|nr:polyprenyl synthetase family protein [Streptomyces sp. DSM 41633]